MEWKDILTLLGICSGGLTTVYIAMKNIRSNDKKQQRDDLKSYAEDLQKQLIITNERMDKQDLRIEAQGNTIQTLQKEILDWIGRFNQLQLDLNEERRNNERNLKLLESYKNMEIELNEWKVKYDKLFLDHEALIVFYREALKDIQTMSDITEENITHVSTIHS